jgi:hypothetical protein
LQGISDKLTPEFTPNTRKKGGFAQIQNRLKKEENREKHLLLSPVRENRTPGLTKWGLETGS